MLYEHVREWREAWGWSPLPSEEYESPPPYSPPRSLSNLGFSPAGEALVRQSSSPSPTQISNPPTPGEPFPSIGALISSTKQFAKENGFRIAKHNSYSYKGRQIRHRAFEPIDAFGLERPITSRLKWINRVAVEERHDVVSHRLVPARVGARHGRIGIDLHQGMLVRDPASPVQVLTHAVEEVVVIPRAHEFHKAQRH